MSLTLLPAGASLVEEVARRIEEAGDVAKALVIFPGKRPAHFLRRRLADKKGSGFVPPRILSMDELVDGIFEERDARQGRVRPKAEPMDAVAILYDIQVATQDPVGGSAFMSLDSFFPLGLKIQGDLEELLIEKAKPEDVAGVQPLVEEEVPARARQRLRTLSHFYEEFYRALDGRDLSTRSSRYVEVSEALQPGEIPMVGPFAERGAEGPVIFAGFFTLTRAEKEIFQAVSKWPSVQQIFQDGPGMRKRMEGFAVSVPSSAPPPAPLPRPQTLFSSSPDTHGQVFAVNAALARADANTLIVLPSPETLFPLLRHCLSRFDSESYNISLPYPLQRAPLYGFFNNLMEVVGSMDGHRVYIPAYVSFVLHPYVKNIRLGASAEATRVLFHALEERLEKTRTRRFMTLEEIEGDAALFEDAAERVAEDGRGPEAGALHAHLIDIHARTIGSFRSFSSVRDFAERCISLISWVQDQSTARDHPYFTPFSESFVQSLDAISRSLMAEKTFTDTRSYFTLLRNYLQAQYLNFPGTPLHGMQVLGGLETRSLQFERVFILDANEGVFPEARTENTLLPFPVRQALGLSTYRDQEDIAAYHFELLAAGAREMHLLYVEGADKERSRFVERLLWERQKEEGLRDERSLIQSISYNVNLTSAPPAPIPKTPEISAWLATMDHSATSLDAYLQCPLKFYYRFVLRLSPREDLSGEIEAVEIGTFVHAVLSRYFEGRKGRPLTEEDADPDAMTTAVDELFAQHFGSAEAGANRLLRNQANRHLRDFLTGYLRPLVGSHRIEIKSLEHESKTKWKGFSLRGRLDVVEERDGAPFLIDYKKSADKSQYRMHLDKLLLEERETWNRAIPTLQLPFYVILHSAETGRTPADIHAMFLLLGRTLMDSSIELPLFEEAAAVHESWPVLEKVMIDLLQEIVSADVSFAPAQDLRAVCPRCDFTAICGTGWLKKG
ncbi:MAG: PD-(D/E)XK nuclease family protein [Spirochaetia bacterium]